ncbi:tyrosine-type recombinase/integrase [Vibrio sp. ZSDE26]|uniref:Tyrosine-type recombinase/integrase n=1 Tax=Vibrio amylolyticus TaxID=2847292 RepID=A0A9X2BL57_9VIBR|nr:tyrosine-type recombinase/integrase [Vibrio amylolyticus]MCK6263588.1 tyrosine-type recombinase/integrase [Vibrio amylolyticus]
MSSPVSLEAFDELTSGVYSRNSLLALVKDWNLFRIFCFEKQVNVLPASTTAVRQFIEHEAKTRKFSTLKRYTVTISLVHRLLASHDPIANSQVRLLIAKYRLDKNGDAKQATSFTLEHLNELDECLSKEHCPKNIRDLAIYFLMFECVLKRSELKALTIGQVDSMESYLHVNVQQHSYRLSERGTFVLRQWLSISGGASDWPLFRAIDRHGNINHSAMDDSSIYRVLRNAGTLIQYPAVFSGQSTRIGGAQHLAKTGHKPKEIQEFGRWLSPAMPYQYIGNRQKAETKSKSLNQSGLGNNASCE